MEDRMQMSQYWRALSPASDHGCDFQFLSQILPALLKNCIYSSVNSSVSSGNWFGEGWI